MSKVLKTVGKIAGIVAAVAARIPGLQPIAAVAAGVSVVANIGAAITAPSGSRAPAIQGSITNITIGADQATPMMIGNVYCGGALVHQAGYGAAIDGVPNPYLGMAMIYSAGGPIAGIDSYWSDFAQIGYTGSTTAGAATGYFNNFLYWRSQNGATPESSALSAQWGGFPGWGSTYKLSGYAAALWSLKWDSKEGKFTSGVPRLGVQGRGVLTWDPRKDSTWPGGSGAHRWVDPRANPAGFAAAKATWSYSDRPGLHALRYALGTWERNPSAATTDPWILRYGVGIPVNGLVVADFIELENVCEANDWRVAGVLLEPGDKWENLKRILAAGGAEPCFKGGLLGCKITAPRVALDTIGRDDIADGAIDADGAQPRENRINTVVPKYRSPAHKWELQQSDEIVISDYLTADKEEKRREEVFEFVTAVTQAAQLATYRLFDSREQGPITLRCKPRMRRYAPGDMLALTDALRDDLGLTQNNVIVLRRAIDPLSMIVTLTLVTENPLKHIAALAVTGTAPATITLPTTEQIDRNSGVNSVLDQIEALAEDGLLTRFEKITKLIPLSTQLSDRWTLLETQGTALSGFAEVASAQSTASSAYSAWISFRNGLSPAWNDTGADTVVDRGTYNTRVNTLAAALDALDQAIKRAATAINSFNRVRNSQFERGTQGWQADAIGSGFSGVSSFTGTNTATGTYFLRLEATAASGAQAVFIATAPAYTLPVTVGERLAVQIAIEGQGSNIASQDLRVTPLDAFGVPLPGGETVLDSKSGPQPYGTPLRGFYTVPSGAAAVRIGCVTSINGTAGPLVAVLTLPMVSSARPGQTEYPFFTPGVYDAPAGANGISRATINIFQRGTTAPPLPSATATYTFATAALTGLNNGWSTSIPAGTDPIWQSAGTAVGSGATDTIGAGEWASAVQIAANGSTPAKTAPVLLYLRTSTPTAPPVPTSSVTYTFATAAATGMDNGWTQSLPASGGTYRWQISATAVSTGETDTIAPSEWSEPKILAQDGANGTNFTLLNQNGTTVGADSVTKFSGFLGWDSSARSQEGFLGAAFASTRLSAGDDYAFGLNTDPTTDNGWTSIDYGWRPSGDGAIRCIENGTEIGSWLYSAGDVLLVVYDGGSVTYYQNGTVRRQVAASANLLLYFDCSIYQPGYVIRGIRFGASGPRGGDGADGADGTDGIDALSVSIAPSAIPVPCTAGGTPKAALPGAQITAFKGTSDVTASASYSIAAVSNLSGVSVSSGGAVSVAGIAGGTSVLTGFVEILVAKDGASQKVKLVYSKALDGAAYVRGTAGVFAPSGSSYETVATVDLLMGPSGTLYADTSGFFTISGTGLALMNGTVDYSMDGGGSWTTAASFTANPAAVGEPGDWGASIALAGNDIGLSSKRIGKVRVQMRRTGAGIATMDGALNVSWAG